MTASETTAAAADELTAVGVAVEELARSVRDVVESYVGTVALEPVDVSTRGLPVSSVVQISGPSQVTVVVSCSRALALTVTAAMLGVSAADVESGDVDDAVGEVANMVGGNVKGMIPGPSLLSLPTVAVGAEHHVVTRTDLVCAVEGAVDGEPLHVAVLVRRRR